MNAPLAVALGLPLAAGLASAAMTRGEASGEWYASLRKPAWSPPAWMFGPVWTGLYLAMGYASYRAWRAGAPLGLYGAQLVLNVAWSLLFFKLHEPGLATLNKIGRAHV